MWVCASFGSGDAFSGRRGVSERDERSVATLLYKHTTGDLFVRGYILIPMLKLTESLENATPPLTPPNVTTNHQARLYPMALTGLLCMIRIGNGEFSMARRTRPFAKRYTLQNHLNIHVAEGWFNHRFRSEWIDGLGHFVNRAAQVHGVWHAVRRCG